jgi:hypothetical protein
VAARPKKVVLAVIDALKPAMLDRLGGDRHRLRPRRAPDPVDELVPPR